jgi:hypothetical protein
VGAAYALLALLCAFPFALFAVLRRAFGPGTTAAQRADSLQW